MRRSGIIEKKAAQGISNPQGPRLLTLKAAAEVLGLTVWGMREAVWRGDIPVVRFPGGRKQFIDRLDPEHFIQSNKTIVR